MKTLRAEVLARQLRPRVYYPWLMLTFTSSGPAVRLWRQCFLVQLLQWLGQLAARARPYRHRSPRLHEFRDRGGGLLGLHGEENSSDLMNRHARQQRQLTLRGACQTPLL